MTVLSDYVTQTRRLLHDVSGNFWTTAELTDYINEARLRTVSDTGCLRVNQTPVLQTNTELYSFGGVTGVSVVSSSGYTAGNYALSFTGGGGTGAAGTFVVASNGTISNVTITTQGSGYLTAPTPVYSVAGAGINNSIVGFINANTVNILSVTIIWGNFRIQLSYMAFTELTARLRMWTTWQQRPAAYSVFGQQSLYIGPLPDQTYVSEMDTVVLPNALIDNSTVEQIAYPYTTPVIYYAAKLAKYKEQSFAEAEMFTNLYKKRALDAISSTFTHRIP